MALVSGSITVLLNVYPGIPGPVALQHVKRKRSGRKHQTSVNEKSYHGSAGCSQHKSFLHTGNVISLAHSPIDLRLIQCPCLTVWRGFGHAERDAISSFGVASRSRSFFRFALEIAISIANAPKAVTPAFDTGGYDKDMDESEKGDDLHCRWLLFVSRWID